jgi:transmembrane protein
MENLNFRPQSGNLPRMPTNVTTSRWTGWLMLAGRIALTYMFWWSGFSKLLDFNSGIAEMTHFGLAPAVPLTIAEIVLQLGASAMVISGQGLAIGAGFLR